MKRFVAIVAASVLALCLATGVSAQNFGIIGGVSFSGIQDVEASAKTGYNVGITSQIKLPLGFSVQPSLMYSCKAAKVGSDVLSASMDVGYIELPVSLQWGPDLLLFRPYLDVAPFVGYALNNTVSTTALDVVSLVTKNDWDAYNMNRLSYGVGLGGGLEIWKLQFSCHYNWNFGPLFNTNGALNTQSVSEMFKDKNFGGVTFSLAFMF